MKALAQRSRRTTSKRSHSGFTLIEVLIASAVLTAGLVGLLGVLAYSVAATQGSQEDMLAKQLASEAMESIFTARETSQLTWDEIRNTGTGDSPDGVFVLGFQPIHLSGADGIFGTADDTLAAVRTLTLPGNDGLVGTSDDRQRAMSEFQRKIEITSVADTSSLRMVTITVQYRVSAARVPKSYVLSSYISQFR